MTALRFLRCAVTAGEIVLCYPMHPPQALGLVEREKVMAGLVRRRFAAARPLRLRRETDALSADFSADRGATVDDLAVVIDRRLADVAALPLMAHMVQQVLGVDREEVQRWTDDKRLPRSGVARFRKGAQMFEAPTYSPTAIAAISARPDLIAIWRARDALREGLERGRLPTGP